MENSEVPVITLSSGEAMPVLGLGTAETFTKGSEREKMAILKAIEVGYRHFDTAFIYQTEESVGEAIAEALQLGFIGSRDELFITSKLCCSDAHPDRVLAALQNSLRNLKLKYLDLYLIHYPISLKPGTTVKDLGNKDNLLPMDYKSVWAAMEECQKLGLTKSIGVSNFSYKKIQELMSFANIPSCRKSKMNPTWQQKNLREYCKANNILVTAYSPLGAKEASWGSTAVMGSEVLNKIALDRGKSVAQISLRWVYEQGVSLVVKSFNEETIKENLKIFDWELTPEELKKIGELSDDGPFKSLEEFWDEM